MTPKFRIHPFLAFIYGVLRTLSWVGLYVFYRQRLVLGCERARFDGATILISNHPSTLMDVLNVGIHVPRIIFFLANYSLFKHPLSNWLLSRLYCIPIKRKEDVPEGEIRNNDVYFEQSYRHLEAGGLLYIAPEGVSWMERRVRPFKTGTARIAFGAESRNQFDLDLKIVPAGLSYTAPNLFRSKMSVQFGEPIYAKDYAAQWQADPEQAVDALTAELERRVRALTIDTKDEAGELLLNKLEIMAAQERPLSVQETFERSQRLAEHVSGNSDLQQRTAAYFGHLGEAELTDGGLKDWSRPGTTVRFFKDGLFLLLGSPLFLLGWLFWALPCFIPWAVAKQLKLYIGYDSNVKFILGLFTFPLAIWTAYHFLHPVLPAAGQTWLVLVGLVLAAYFVEWYWVVFDRMTARWRAASVAKYHPGLHGELMAQRGDILKEIALYL